VEDCLKFFGYPNGLPLKGGNAYVIASQEKEFKIIGPMRVGLSGAELLNDKNEIVGILSKGAVDYSKCDFFLISFLHVVVSQFNPFSQEYSEEENCWKKRVHSRHEPQTGDHCCSGSYVLSEWKLLKEKVAEFAAEYLGLFSSSKRSLQEFRG